MDEEMKLENFKAECLKVIEKIRKTRCEIIITKRSVPIAKLVPIEEERKFFGKQKGTIHFKGDVVGPIIEVWNATT